MRIIVGNVYSYIDRANDDKVRRIASKERVFAPGYRYSKLFKNRKWDGKVSVFTGKSFPTGLVPHVCHRNGINEINFQSPPNPLKLQGNYGSFLRPYQIEAINAAFTNTYGGSWWPRGIIKVATGGGKTEIACAMIKAAGVRTLFLVHRKDLLTQTIDRFKKYGLNASQVGSGVKDFSGDIVVATVQTLWKMRHTSDYEYEMARFEQLFIDEAHLLAAKLDQGNIFVQVCNSASNAYMRWGLTATPCMKDDYSSLLLRGVTGDVLYEITNRELIDQGYLTEAKVEMIEIEPSASVVNKWPACYDTGIVINKERNEQVVNMAMNGAHPCLILVQRVAHGKVLQDMFRAKGKYVPYVDGSSSAENREMVKSGLTNGTINIAIASTIWDEGMDIPSLRMLIMAGGGKSVVKNMQRLGRGLRIAQGKTEVRVVDFFDKYPRWLRTHSLLRRKIWEDAGFTVCKS